MVESPVTFKGRQAMQRTTFPVILKSAKKITPSVRHLAFQRQDGEKLDYIPGQFISFHLPNPENDTKPLRRSYSIATIPGQGDDIELALGYVKGGKATETLFTIEEGTELIMSGPYGRLILRDEQPQRYILTATSTGVTPYRAMLKEISQRLMAQPSLEVILLLGVKDRREQLYTDDFLQLAQQNSRFEFRICYSREKDFDALPHEYSGYVQHQFSTLHLDPTKDIVYLCGNPNMIDNAYELLKDQGFTPQQVRREKYVS